MNRLVLHHYYARTAFDLSNNRNHGYPVDVVTEGGANAPSFEFEQPGSIVRVPLSPTLSDLISVRASVTFNASDAPISRRLNLMEGHLSFALFVERDASLMGTILDHDGNWKGARSAAGLVSPNGWHTAELYHDGISGVRLVLDGTEVAATADTRGPVRSVGPHGVAIGHWPEAPGVYTFRGFLREAKLWKYDPYRDVNGMLDHCCIDRSAIDRAVNELRQQGETAESVGAKAREILGFALDLAAEVRRGDAAVAREQQQLSERAFTSFLRGDQANYVDSLTRLAGLARQRLSDDQKQALADRRDELVQSLPLTIEDLQKLIHALCWDRVHADPSRIEEAVADLGNAPTGPT